MKLLTEYIRETAIEAKISNDMKTHFFFFRLIFLMMSDNGTMMMIQRHGQKSAQRSPFYFIVYFISFKTCSRVLIQDVIRYMKRAFKQ